MKAYEKLADFDLSSPTNAGQTEETKPETPSYNPSFHNIYDELTPRKEEPPIAIQIGTEDLDIEIQKLESSIAESLYEKYINWLYVIIVASCLFILTMSYLGVTNWDIFGYLSILGLVNILNCGLVIIGIKTKDWVAINVGAGLMLVFMVFLLGAAIYMLADTHIFVGKPKWVICVALWAGFIANVCIISPAWRVRNILEEIVDIQERRHYRRMAMSGSVVAPAY